MSWKKGSVFHDLETWQRIYSKMEDDSSTCDSNSNQTDTNSDFDENNVENENGNPKLADALGRVLRMAQNKTKNKKSIVLSKAKLHVEKSAKRDICEFEIQPNPSGEEQTVKIKEDPTLETKEDQKSLKKKVAKQELIKRGRIIPSISDREKERYLAKIATRGVVQLFNAVRHQQTTLQKHLSEKKLTEAKKEKILKSVNRKSFLDALAGTVNVSLSKGNYDDPVKEEIKDEEVDEDDNIDKPQWEVLRNDFMMNPKLKDWDKKRENEAEGSN